MSDASGPDPPGTGTQSAIGQSIPYSRGSAGLSSRTAWGTGTLPTVDPNLESPEELVAAHLDLLRARNAFAELAESLPEESLPRRIAAVLAVSFPFQVFLAFAGYLCMGMAFKVLIGGGVESYEGLNYFLFLYLLTAAIYFGRYGAAGVLASLALIFAAILSYAAQITGFRPSLFFLVTHPLVSVMTAAMYTTIFETAAQKTASADTARRQLENLEQRRQRSGADDEGVLQKMKDAEVRLVQLRTNFSDLLANLRELGGAHKEDAIYSTIFRLLSKGLGAEMADIWFLTEGGGELKVEEARVAGGADMVPTQFSLAIPHDGSTVISRAVKEKRAVLPDEISRDPAMKRLATSGAHPTKFCFPIMVKGEVGAVVNVSKGPSELDAQQKALLQTISQIAGKAFEGAHTFQLSETERKAAVNMSEKERAERIRTRETLERFVSKNVVDDVMANPRLSENMETTILLADLRGFTTLSERLPPEVVVEMLNDYFGVLTPLIFDYGGTLDKYIGDMVMALFGPPRPTGKDASSAVLCAVEMRQAFQTKFVTKWEPKVRSKLEVGICMNTGKATVGLLGSERLVNYTAIGDAVNTASRLEDLTPGGRILMTEATARLVTGVVEAKLVGAKMFKGKTEKTKIYEVRGVKARTGANPSRPHVPAPAPAAPPIPPPPPAPAPPRAPAPAAPAAPAPAAPQAAAPPSGAGVPCPLCQAPVAAGSQSCGTCGMKL